MEKNYKYQFTTPAGVKFNDFLNKTIIGTSYNFFNENNKIKSMRENFSDDILERYNIVQKDGMAEVCFLEKLENEDLEIATQSLTSNERKVIVFVYEEELSGEEIAQKLKINTNTVYIIKKRAVGKLKKIIEEEKSNGRY